MGAFHFSWRVAMLFRWQQQINPPIGHMNAHLLHLSLSLFETWKKAARENRGRVQREWWGGAFSCILTNGIPPNRGKLNRIQTAWPRPGDSSRRRWMLQIDFMAVPGLIVWPTSEGRQSSNQTSSPTKSWCGAWEREMDWWINKWMDRQMDKYTDGWMYR